MGQDGEKGAVAKQQRAGPFWQKTLLFLCVGSILLFSVFVVLDAESAMHWSGLSTLSSKLEFAMPGAPQSKFAFMPEDDPTCLSRTQQMLFRRQSREFPNSLALTKALERYISLHKSCTYGKNWTDVLLNGAENADDCNYLVYVEGGAGLGNRILSLISAFGFALATDRVLLMDSKRSLHQLLCDPFPGSSWLLPEGFPYEKVSSAPSLAVAVKQNYSMPIVNLHLEHIQSYGDQLFFCDDTHFKLMNVRWVGWTSTQYYITRLFTIPSFWRRLLPLFASDMQVFTQLSRAILLPSNDIWGHIVRVYWGYLSCTGKRVGVQIRLHGRWDLAAFDPAVNRRVMDCLTENDILPRTADEDNVTQLSALSSRRIQLRSDQSPTDYAILVASLQHRYFEEMQTLFSRNPTVDNSIVRVHMVSHSGHQDNSLDQAQNALAEMWLLSYSDVIATSAYSTFGYVAQGLGGMRPYILNIRGDKVGQDGLPACFLSQSSEPCTHYPMSIDCQGVNVTPEHKEWINERVKECQDQPGGLQLIDKPSKQ